MAITIIEVEKVCQCENCKIGLNFLNTDEQMSSSRTYLYIRCPRCGYEVVTTKLKNYRLGS